MRARLSLLDGEARPNHLDLAPEQPISIGRSRDNTVVLPDEEQASRLHARLYFEGGRWLLRDFGLNGTRVDNARVNQVAELTNGNEIRIGAVKFQFQLPEPARAVAPPNGPSGDRSVAAETLAGSTAGLRWTVDELNAQNQFMAAAVATRDAGDLARTAVQALFYQTGASLVGLFTPDPTDPVAKVVWPEAAQVDESLARQLTRRMHRDQRIVWLAEDTAATLPTQSGTFSTAYADALALPLKVGKQVFGSFHLCKANGHFSERDRKFAEGIASFAAQMFRSLFARRTLEADVSRLKASHPDGEELVGDSPTMVSLRSELARVASGSRPILILGEAGVGKCLAAQEAHRVGPRSKAPFVAVRCAGTPVALLEAEIFGYRKGAFSGAERDHAGHVAQADDGTLFFDEIGDLPLECQARLLRLIERRTYRMIGATYDSRADVKVMAASCRDLAAEVKAGRFRGELLGALRAAEVAVPPLRQHVEDIPHLAQFFLDRIGAEFRREWEIDAEAIRLLRDRPWPGNVRQLKSVLNHAASAAVGDTISADNLRALLGDSNV
jgi:Nif-specific regulatory protein